jgi:hypothetical protein
MLAHFAAAVLQWEPPVFAVTNAYASEARAGFDAGVMAERRCKWTPRREVCDWVKNDRKQKKSR